MGDDPLTGTIVSGGITPQTHRAIQNIRACLEAADSSLDKVVRRRIYIMDMKDFREVDRIWAEYFTEPFPVSTCVQVAGLAKEGALVELEVVAEV
jgi:2-iminobutanoate/2-iminopropanoate deaminase